MNRIVATVCFVRSAWSVEAFALAPLWHGTRKGRPPLAHHRTGNSCDNADNKLLCKRHHSVQRSTGVLFLSSPSPSPSATTRQNTESSPATTTTTTTTTPGCIGDEGVRRLLSVDDFEFIDALVRERSEARSQGNYTGADDLKNEISTFSGVPDGFELFLQDIPRKSGGGSRWGLVPSTQHTHQIDDEFASGTRILQLAHTAMGLAVDDNQQPRTQTQMQLQQRQQYRTKSLESLVDQAKARLEILLEETRTMEKNTAALDIEVSTKQTLVRNELGGRTAADAALWFALAGSRDTDLFHGLADIASWELNRFGQRPSCRSKNIYQILERFAAAGLKRHEKLERIAHACLLEKEKQQQQEEGGATKAPSDGVGVGIRDDTGTPTPSYLNLHSDRSLLLIWKFATKQKKQQAFLRTAKKNWEQYRETEMDNATTQPATMAGAIQVEGNTPHSNERCIESPYNWGGMFENSSRPLVVDIGCGMGVSLLGLASTTDQHPSEKESARLLLGQNLKWSDCNFVGVDLGSLGIEYGRGVSHRWNSEGNLHFAIDAAEDFCQHLRSYPGEIRCCMIQFPTPFRLQNKDGGNSQLPASQLEGFMVTEKLLRTIHSSLHPKHGKLLLQSNCEDVAVWMRNLACRSIGFTALDDDSEDQSQTSIPQRMPQRTQEWIAMGGERAEGRSWFRRNILHRRGATETEATCAINGTPIHRCLLTVDQ